MSNYISYENQTMLWNTIKNVPLFLEQIEIQNQTEWFKSIIGKIYNDNSDKFLDITDLMNLNRATIKYMIDLLKTQKKNNEIKQEKPNYIEESKDDYMTRKFEYDSMLRKEKPEEPKFIENIGKDEVIENMDDLLQKQIKERNMDLNIQKSVNFSLNNNVNNEEIKLLKEKIYFIQKSFDLFKIEIRKKIYDSEIVDKMEHMIKLVCQP
tara:strand:+ start:16962 stop:17588 length:627 start_codon:yes stop_codon:yes gene_type:complete